MASSRICISDEFSQGTCFPAVSARREKAEEKGSRSPFPSYATAAGSVAKAISAFSELFTWARPVLPATISWSRYQWSLRGNGLLRQTDDHLDLRFRQQLLQHIVELDGLDLNVGRVLERCFDQD